MSTSTTINTQAEAKKKPIMPMLLFGCISGTAYTYLMTHQELVTNTFTKGGWYAAFPILAAFFFSFAHGAFASNLLSVFGIEAKK
jgi:hypothetical protein